VSLSAHDRRALDLIGESLAGSDPRLAAMMSAFSRLADGEAMPGRERIQADRHLAGQAIPAALAALPGRCWRRMAAQRWVTLTWLVISLVLITLALVASHTGSSAACVGWTVPACGNHAPAHRHRGREDRYGIEVPAGQAGAALVPGIPRA
jgi:hypothetical protein